MPLIRKVETGIWEVRSSLDQGIARVLFTVEGHIMVLLIGFIKKSQKTPLNELQTARQRLADLKKE
jgi:phage-related protein